jgi:hypothetical protein
MMPEDSSLPIVVAFVADVFFQVKIDQAAQGLGYRVEWVERAEQVATPAGELQDRQLGEHLLGPGAALLDRLTLWQPALILVDLNNAAIPWREWVSLIKSAPATRRIPLVCFGSHVDTGSLGAARERGAEAVLARSQFSASLPEVIRKYARLPDYAGIESACQHALSASALRGLEEFNRGEYFQAHESLEEAWNEDQTAGRELYRAILQVAVAYLQIERKNYNGAIKMFLRLRQWITPLPDECRGVDIARLKADAQQVYERLVALGQERIVEFDPGLFQPVRYRTG